MTTTLEQIAAQTAEKIVALTGFGHVLHVNDILPDIREALQTATKQPQGADWATEALAKIQGMNDSLHEKLAKETEHATGWRMRASELQLALKPFAEALDEDVYEKDATNSEIRTLEFSVGEMRAAHKAYNNESALRPLVANREDYEAVGQRHTADRISYIWTRTPDEIPEGTVIYIKKTAAMRPAQPERGQGEGTT